MPPETISLSGLALMLVLGLRHGLDPDHIAIIDALSLRMSERRPRWAPWAGTLFALGHGAVVTLIAVGVSLGAQALAIPQQVLAVGEWVPVALLLFVGLSNLKRLLQAGAYQASGWLTRFAPRRLLNTSHPLGVFAVGAIFAAIFDTITQAAAWGYIATQQGGVAMALLTGLVFTFGMAVTDTLDSQLLCRLLRSGSEQEVQKRQRAFGWVIVVLSLGVVAYSLTTKLWPALTLSETSYTTLGMLAVGALVLLAWLTRKVVAEDRYP